ncbi:unnamed protein product [Parnassius apollo]|uniref:(apollo) hypothetical protein n=1 Tax=Parnassius apollo TaxID=110799 RepID=A0A8S3Y2P9_PARAO|nr:unnamed protein product [Parnassius apollo]
MSDTDVTDCEENLKNLSPSILTQNAANEWTGVIEQRNVQNPQSSNHITKLVDYSSLESYMDDLQEQLHMQTFLDINFRYSSPVPTTSGTSNIQPRPRLNSITSDSSEEEEITTFLKNFQYPSKLIVIYTSSSDSNERKFKPKIHRTCTNL